MSEILEKVRDYIKQHNIKGTVLVALSGGCDSVVLTHILHVLKLNVIAIHLNHNWRGDESGRDEDFSRNFAKSLGMDFYSETLPVDIKKTELEGRLARYDFFERCAKKFGTDFVFLAHNKNDNAETLLYRVIKGTGLRGLCAIPSNRDIFYRPLLDVTRAEIENYAKSAELNFITDSSNKNTKYHRNLIREEILPLAQKINPEIIETLSNFSNLAKMQYQILTDVLNCVKDRVYKGDRIILEEFLGLSEPLKYEIINDFLSEDLKYRDFNRIKSYVDFIVQNSSSSAKKSVNAQYLLEISGGYIFKTPVVIKKNTEAIEIFGEGVYEFMGQKVLIECIAPPKDLKLSDGFKYLSHDFNKPLFLRTRRAGDVFRPYGSKFKKKLKDYLIDKKIPRQERENLLLLANNTNCGDVFCILGFQISMDVAVKKDAKTCYRVRILE